MADDDDGPQYASFMYQLGCDLAYVGHGPYEPYAYGFVSFRCSSEPNEANEDDPASSGSVFELSIPALHRYGDDMTKDG